MRLRNARIYVTKHAVDRYRQRLGTALAPEDIEALVRQSKPVSISAKRRYRLRWSGTDNHGMTWQRHLDAFYLIRTANKDFVCVTVVSIRDARRHAKQRAAQLTAQGSSPKR